MHLHIPSSKNIPERIERVPEYSVFKVNYATSKPFSAKYFAAPG